MEMKINFEKKHFWILLAAILVGTVAIVVATAPAGTIIQSHDTLYTDTIIGKTGGTVTVNDNLIITTTKGITLGGIARSSWTGTPVSCSSGYYVSGIDPNTGAVVCTALPSSAIPSGYCVFSDTMAACPSGWTDKTSTYSGRTIKASSSTGTGGSDTHSHSVTATTSSDYACKSGGVTCTAGHIHETTVASPTGTTSSWPLYTNVKICCKT